MSDLATREFSAPGKGRGLKDALHNKYLLKLLVDKEIQVRYRGSVLGIVWSYIKPAIQFLVFYLALGIFLGLEKGLQNYSVYLFSGIIVINFFSECFSNGARAFVVNGALIKKIYLPRQLFSLSTIWVGVIHFLPQILVLIVACLFVGWTPDLKQIGAIIVGVLLVMVFGLAAGMVFGVANVFFRDSENLVDMFLMMATWLSPVMYSWTMVAREVQVPNIEYLYMSNPLTVAVELFHYAFWQPTLSGEQQQLLLAAGNWYMFPNLLTVWVPIAFGISLVLLLLGNWLFRTFEGNFAQEL
ncbi:MULTISPECIES: ABC transporter permease [unclassified Rothia (in: high G+C Gram-positive bacteria)]|uniref:ABC transporter permease n=1 Tax=unclassified Rothia (in: high G+C Gram-positive bacteria) TaxID=2689056 RepID=UPI00195CBEFC|nr:MULTISPECIES: ABC transporter permease [unclassified Rothia (in: high G+C Gram-positive bacteria)]MBM7050832.1 ABC transporter permease [Rothia sp. ZJ1223]QRZ61006.1 ABC transporter permease [Rothia sp. ZJ932]